MSTSTSNRRRRRALGLTLGVMVVALVAVGAWLGPISGLSAQTGDNENEAAATPDGPATALDTITRGDLVESQEETGTLAHGDPWSLQIEAQGIVTNAPDAGATINFGQTLIEIDAKPVVLAEGDVPLYRSLNYQARKHLKGPDVEQLQQLLLDLGHDDSGRLEADGDFGLSTHRAVKAWQKSVGRDQSGTVDRSQLVFNPQPVRIDTSPRIGSSFEQLSVTEAKQRVTAQFSARQQAFVEVGNRVELQLGSGETMTGSVAEATSTVSDQGERVIKVVIEPGGDLPDGTEKLKVIASRVSASDVLIVPVRAVLALAGGGYGLEVDTDGGTELRAAELGAVVDTQVEISGSFTEGEQVVVPIDLLDSVGAESDAPEPETSNEDEPSEPDTSDEDDQ